MNKVVLIGNLTKDPEYSGTTNGIAVVKFTIAVKRKFKNADGETESDFIPIVAWRNLANVVRDYVKKGQKVGVFGHIQTRTYETPEHEKRYVTEVIAEDIEFLTNIHSDDVKIEQNKGKTEINPIDDIDDDDLPF